MKALKVYGGGAMLASTSLRVGRMEKAPDEMARLTGREPDDSISSSESLSEEVGDNSGVAVGVWFRKKRDGANVFFLSIAYSVRRGPLIGFFLTGRPLRVGRGSSLVKRAAGYRDIGI